MQTTWKEVARVLKPDGKAYIFPIEEGSHEGDEFDNTEFEASVASLSWYNGGNLKSDIKVYNGRKTLILEKMQSQQETIDTEQITRISRYALGDAIVLAYTSDDSGDINMYGLAYEDKALAQNTRAQCSENSTEVIEYLAKKYPEHFDRLFLLRTYEDSNHTFRDPDWGFHACFVTRDVGGKWYVGSPSNYDPSMRENSLNTFFEGHTLQEALDKFQQIEGGDWGDAKQIEKIAYIHPRIESAHGRNYSNKKASIITSVTVHRKEGVVQQSVVYFED